MIFLRRTLQTLSVSLVDLILLLLFNRVFLRLNQLLYALCCHTSPTQKLFCLHVFRQAGPSQRSTACWFSRLDGLVV